MENSNPPEHYIRPWNDCRLSGQGQSHCCKSTIVRPVQHRATSLRHSHCSVSCESLGMSVFTMTYALKLWSDSAFALDRSSRIKVSLYSRIRPFRQALSQKHPGFAKSPTVWQWSSIRIPVILLTSFESIEIEAPSFGRAVHQSQFWDRELSDSAAFTGHCGAIQEEPALNHDVS